MRNLRNTAKIYKSAGFTVLETMVAIIVASLAIAGASLAAQGGIRAASIAKEEVRAFYMAQEVLELLNNKKDTNELSNIVNGTNVDWLAGVASVANDPCYPGKRCILDPWEYPLFRDCGVGPCPKIMFKDKPGDYRYGYLIGLGGFPELAYIKNTQYTRELSIEKSPSGNEVLVTINITWDHAGSTRQFKVKTLLTNWLTSSTSE